MEKTVIEQDQQSYPLMRIITFGEFALERLVPSNQVRSPCYSRILPEEWNNRGPAMTLLKVLLCRTRRRASKNELIATIWPDRDTINAAHALDSATSILRRRVLRAYNGESLLLTTHVGGETSFKLPPQPLLWVDADALLTLATQSLQAASQGQNPRALLETAHALAHGEFLEDDLAYPWAQRRRHTINGARRRILYRLVELYLKEKRVNQAEELLYVFLEENPTDEDALCRLMILLTEQERRQEALQLYHYTMDILHEERSEPALYTRELAARIQRGLAIREQMTDYIATSTAILPTPGRTVQITKNTRRAACSYTRRVRLIAMGIYLQYVIIRRWCIMRVEADKVYYGNYKFVVELDTGAETGTNQRTVWFAEKVNIDTVPLERQCFDQAILQQESRLFGDERFLRDFYFEEANTNYIRNFCRKFATNEAYRQQVLARETAWTKRNALFLRNLLIVFREQPYPVHARDNDEHKALDFFHWINKHFEAILALPEYQHLQQIDNACKVDAGELDPLIRHAVELLNQIPGVTVRCSCQGVSGKVCFQERELLVVSEHEEHAYVSFSVLEQSVKDAIEVLLPEFPSITNVRLPGNFPLWPVLCSTGDNLRFRAELVAFAKRVLDRVAG